MEVESILKKKIPDGVCARCQLLSPMALKEFMGEFSVIHNL